MESRSVHGDDTSVPHGGAAIPRLLLVEQELEHTREGLRTSIERLESANGALQCANEEIRSFNEELQAANEELEAAQEELRSLNEELATLNVTLTGKLAELAAANDDLANLFSSTDIATVFVDREIKIRRFTPSIVPLMNLLPIDIGRPLRDIRLEVPDAALIADIARVLESLVAVECELESAEGRCYLRRVLPYRTRDSTLGGAAIAFIDISARKRAEETLQARERELRAAVERLNREILEKQQLETALVESTSAEQRKLGRDLHDGLGQELSGLAMLASATAATLTKAGRPEAAQVKELAHIANRAVANCRAIAHGMSPLALAGGSLVAALQEMVKLQRNSFGVDARCEVTETAPLRLSPEAQESLYRIAQEAVANARRHGDADVIRVVLCSHAKTVRLEVADNGIGMSQAVASPTGMGLKVMAFRAALIGARFAIAPQATGGTRITVECQQASAGRLPPKSG